MLLIAADAALLKDLHTRLAAHHLTHVAVAVSGGGDSVALLHLMSRVAQAIDIRVQAVTVDHSLRPEAAGEAHQVSRWAAEWGIEHTTLNWSGWSGDGNLQAEARKARYEVMAEWARQEDVQALLVGHTSDDQAETVLMGLSRASGVDGLAAMPEHRVLGGITLMRPVLHHSRQDLRDYLGRQSLDWIEDPSNQNARFERIRMRQAGAALSELGLSTPALAQVAQNMAHVQAALDYHTQAEARVVCKVDAGDVVLDMDRFVNLPQETARRLLLGAVAWVNGGTDRPRRIPTMMALTAIGQGTPAQLGGCRIVKQRKWMRVCREFNAVRDLRVNPGELWDNRWRMIGPDHEQVTIAALGEKGLLQCPEWRETGRPHAALTATPAAWRGGVVIAAPFAAAANGWGIQGPSSEEEFFATLLSH
ncbi:tRNA lysidine(34) synthetase TilS [Tropicibacter sp. Alg240-R139]|uniref:tRNA lysidine(34) synthetase TilS n=1 Tax=Tropicibacter sp. Alg240-R139 TaxID=2305991 RepID=UPI00196744D3|nr:tRNA lysidine(34) synthetase TilS [Tropicibacter sp. Alg240-R139]